MRLSLIEYDLVVSRPIKSCVIRADVTVYMWVDKSHAAHVLFLLATESDLKLSERYDLTQDGLTKSFFTDMIMPPNLSFAS